MPALVVAGSRDDTVPLEDVEAWVARTPSARLVVVDDGHELTASLDRIFEEARAFLLTLAGQTHRVVTGVAVVDAGSGRTESDGAVTAVTMRPFCMQEALRYAATGEPLDKAGAYGIQGRGGGLGERPPAADRARPLGRAAIAASRRAVFAVTAFGRTRRAYAGRGS